MGKRLASAMEYPLKIKMEHVPMLKVWPNCKILFVLYFINHIFKIDQVWIASQLALVYSINFLEEPPFCKNPDCSKVKNKMACFITCFEPLDPKECKNMMCSESKAVEICKHKCHNEGKFWNVGNEHWLNPR